MSKSKKIIGAGPGVARMGIFDEKLICFLPSQFWDHFYSFQTYFGLVNKKPLYQINETQRSKDGRVGAGV